MYHFIRSPRRGGRVRKAIAIAAVSALVLVASPAVSDARPTHVQRADVMGQGGDGTLELDGARLQRSVDGVSIRWKVPTPESGSYLYPTNDQVPPGASHPEVTPGDPEVFTLWAFVFNHPDLCNGPCDSDDLGDTPAKGGVYRLDGVIADKGWVKMRGAIADNATPAAFVPLTEPDTAEIHVAMAPHGHALSGVDLQTQLNVAVGTPAHWWAAVFLTP